MNEIFEGSWQSWCFNFSVFSLFLPRNLSFNEVFDEIPLSSLFLQKSFQFLVKFQSLIFQFPSNCCKFWIYFLIWNKMANGTKRISCLSVNSSIELNISSNTLRSCLFWQISIFNYRKLITVSSLAIEFNHKTHKNSN